MRSKAPILVFTSSFLAFLVIFFGLLLHSKPELADNAMTRMKLMVRTATDTARASLRTRRFDRRPVDRPAATESQPVAAFLQGTVADESGHAVAEANIAVLDAAQSAPQVLYHLSPDENGKFHTLLDEGLDKVQLLIITPKLGRWRSATLTVTPGAGIRLGTIRLTAPKEFAVSVTNNHGDPVQDARVEVRDPDDELNPTWHRPLLEGVTAADGTATLRGADFGKYEVEVTAEQCARSQNTYDHREVLNGVDITLMTADQYIHGSVLDPNGRTINQGEVEAQPLDPTSGILPARAGLDGDGRFKIGPLPRGEYQLVLDSPGIRQQAPISATAGGPTVRLRAAYDGKVQGYIRAPRNLSKPELVVLRHDQRGALLPLQQPKTTFSSDSLEFALEGMAPGTYVVRVEVPDLAAGRSAPFTLTAGEPKVGIVVNLGSGATLRGSIVDAFGQAVVGAKVTVHEGEATPPPAMLGLVPESVRTEQNTGEQGSFAFTSLSPGSHVLVCEAPGAPTRTIGPLYVSKKMTYRLGNIVIGGGGSISGNMAYADGVGVMSSGIQVRSPDDRTWFVVSCDRQGNYSLRGLPAGQYFLKPVSSTKPDSIEVFLEAGQHLRQDLVLIR